MVSAIVGHLRSNSLWVIAPDANQIAHRIRVIREALTPTTFEEAAYWLSRFLQHFPTKSAERDAIIISDVSAFIVEKGYGIGATVGALDALRNAATIEKPFMPPSGAIIQLIQRKHETYTRILAADIAKQSQGNSA